MDGKKGAYEKIYRRSIGDPKGFSIWPALTA